VEDRIKTPPVYSKRLRAGARRTYFFDVRTTRSNDYYLTIVESKKRHDETYDRHKIFLYKEDFNKFIEALTETINEVKTKYMPEYDFEEFDRNDDHESSKAPAHEANASTKDAPTTPQESLSDEEFETWA
jgi:hypothetical protein